MTEHLSPIPAARIPDRPSLDGLEDKWAAVWEEQGTYAFDREAALAKVLDAVDEVGLHVHGLRASPISGTTGNTEYLLWARSVPSDTMSGQQVRALARCLSTDTPGGRR